jgi:hypothetical protein
MNSATKHKRRGAMLELIVFVAAYILVVHVVLPRFGIQPG